MSASLNIVTLNPNLVESDIIITETASQLLKQAILIRCLPLVFLIYFTKRHQSENKLKMMDSLMVWHVYKWGKHKLLRNICDVVTDNKKQRFGLCSNS